MPKAKVDQDETDYTKYLDKEPTDLQARFAAWLSEKVGIEFGTKKEGDAFCEGVRLATALRMPFQRSPENQEVLEERRGAAEEEERPAKKHTVKATRRRAESESEPDEKPKARKSAKTAKAAPADEPDEEEVAEEPTRAARRPARKRAGRAATTAEAPF